MRRREATYDVIIHGSHDRLVASEIRQADTARRLARREWEAAAPGSSVSIIDSDGRAITASQAHGRGMLWSGL